MSETENENQAASEAPAEAPPRLKLRVDKRRAKSVPLKSIRLGHGLFAQCVPLDAFEHALTLAEARADLNALIIGAPPVYAWTFTAARIEQLRASDDMRQVTLGWMRNVLTATRSVKALDDGAGGPSPLELVTYAEDGETELASDEAPAPSFALFELLFHDATMEMRFRVAAFEIESIWSAEKNVSAPVPSGHGRADLNSAQGAEQTATHAAGEALESLPMAVRDNAHSPPTHRAPQSEQSPGRSDAAQVPGTESA